MNENPSQPVQDAPAPGEKNGFDLTRLLLPGSIALALCLLLCIWLCIDIFIWPLGTRQRILMCLLLFALLIIRGYWLALNARDRFGSLVIVGITTLFAFQVFANVAVVTNLFPVTGISLPFFSYGGSALIIQLAEMGLILSISRQNPAS